MKQFLKITCASCLIIWATALTAQQMEIESSSDFEGPQLLLKEVDSTGFTRLQFVNASEPDSKWAFGAKPKKGSFDNLGKLLEPLVFAYDGDRGFTGDQLQFDGGSGFVNLSNSTNLSTIAKNSDKGVLRASITDTTVKVSTMFSVF